MSKTFVLELKKTIVIEIEAKDEQAAIELAMNNDYEDDGACRRKDGCLFRARQTPFADT